jgi:hypothetical protein
VIQEDEEEVPHAPDAHGSHDVDEHEIEEREASPVPQETEEDTEYSVDPNGSQYESGNDEFPLNAFDDYMEVKGSDEDSDIVYIRAAREISPSQMKELMSIAHTDSVSERSMTAATDNTSTGNQNVSLRTMEDVKDVPRQYRYRLVKPTGTTTRPERENGEDLCLAGYVTINGVKAYTLFDSGSTTDAVSPDFARVSNVPILRLEKPATLQLGCSGSRSKINFATITVVKFGSTTAKNYLDIANLDKYDCILGTPFLRKHGISLDFEFQEIVIRGKLCIPALPEGEGASMMKPI